MENEKYKIGIIGLGYVGLPLAVEFSSKFYTVGFDVNKKRINEIDGRERQNDLHRDGIGQLFRGRARRVVYLTPNIQGVEILNYLRNR